MLFSNCRTDIAIESLNTSKSLQNDTKNISGAVSTEKDIKGFPVVSVKIENNNASEIIGKPIGTYHTINIDSLISRQENAFSNACEILSSLINEFLPNDKHAPVLVVGLGNRNITPDAIGPYTSEYLLATRHLLEQNISIFDGWRAVSVISCGVLGQTGIEVKELVTGVIDKIKPCLVVAVDALATNDSERLCRTIQLSNAGIVPGSGVQNSRSALNEQTLGVPVIALGAPTVIDASNIFSDDKKTPLLVTTRDIDRDVLDISRVIGYSLNMAFQPDLTPETIDLYLS